MPKRIHLQHNYPTTQISLKGVDREILRDKRAENLLWYYASLKFQKLYS